VSRERAERKKTDQQGYFSEEPACRAAKGVSTCDPEAKKGVTMELYYKTFPLSALFIMYPSPFPFLCCRKEGDDYGIILQNLPPLCVSREGDARG